MNYLINNPLASAFFKPIYWLIGIGIFILIYLALREFRCWYFKTNKILKLLEEIKHNIASQNKEKEPSSTSPKT